MKLKFRNALACLGLLLLLASGSAHGQAGILSTARTSPNWVIAGVPGGLPDGSWTQCGASISAYSGTATTINNALAACGLNQYVFLGPGTFSLSSGIQFPKNTIGHVVLRGSGSNSTFINYTSGVNCNGASAAICISSNDGTYPGTPSPTTTTWTAGYSQGTTQITLGSVAGIVPDQTILVLNQCDTGYSASDCNTGAATDNNGYFICSTPWTSTGFGCNLPMFAPDGSTWRNNAWEMETVMVTAINAAGCGATCVTISQPLEHPNWASGQSPQAVIIQPVPLDGVEDLALDGSGAGTTDACIGGQNTWEAFVSGVKCTNSYSRGFYFLDSFHLLIQNNYIAHANTFGGGYGDGMGIRISWGGDDLIQNNIVQQWKVSFVNDGPAPGEVIGYNYFIDQRHRTQEDDFMWGGTFQHATGDDFQLFEGNAMNQSQDDNIHGGHVNQVRIRNFFWGYEQCANAQCGSFSAKTTSETAIISSSTSRYGANVGNVLGTPGFTSIYLNSTPFGSGQAYQIGGGNGGTSPPLPNDPLAVSTTLFWDNWDAFTNGIVCDNAQVPTTAPTYPLSVPTLGCGGGTLSASFYLSGKPDWFGSVPYPAIGPDVSGGNVGQCDGPLNTAGKYNGLAATSSSLCAGNSLNTAWDGHVNAIPAMACFFSMGGVPDGTGGVLDFDSKACYGSGSGSTTAAAPSFSPSSGAPPQTVTVTSSTMGAIKCWNTTGSPGPINGASSCPGGSTLYSGTISVTTDETIYAVAGGPGLLDSSVSSATYTSGGGSPTWSISPTSFDFGTVPVGVGSAVQTFTITNSGTAPLTVAVPFAPSGTYAGDFADVENNCASAYGGVITVAVGHCYFRIQFTPTISGGEGTSITFTTDDSAGTHTLSLAGDGGILASTRLDLEKQVKNILPRANGGTGASSFPEAGIATVDGVQGQSYVYASGGGTGNAQTVALTPAVPSYTAGLVISWLPTAANSSTTPTLNVNSLGTKTIIKAGGSALAANDLTSLSIATAIYDGTYFELQNPQTAPTGGGSCSSCATQLGVQASTYTYAAGGGSANAQTVTLSPALGSYGVGDTVNWKPTAANTTSTPTLNVNGLGTKTIVKVGGAALAANDLTTSAVATAIYDGTNFELQNPQTVPATVPINPLTSSLRVASWVWKAGLSSPQIDNPPTSDYYVAFGGVGGATGCATSSVPPCVTQGNGQGYDSAFDWLVGQNIDFQESGQLTTTVAANQCTIIQVNNLNNTQQSCSSLGGLLTNASFLFGGTLAATDWGCVTASGSARAIVDSGVAADTNPHIFEIVFNDSVPNVVFKIDGSAVCTITSPIPASGSVMQHEFYVGGTTGGLYREFGYYIQSGNSW